VKFSIFPRELDWALIIMFIKETHYCGCFDENSIHTVLTFQITGICIILLIRFLAAELFQ
jgi:hypothetical protein